MTRSEPAVRIEGITCTYPQGRRGPQPPALRDLSLTIQAGEFVLLVGQSGSGKSTLLRCINGLIPHSHRGRMAGRVVVAGMETREHQVCEIARTVGTVFQNPEHQLFSGDVESELAFGPEHLGVEPERIRERIARAAEATGIGHLMNREENELSWGERQRLAISSVLAMEPDLLLLDEPVSGLDAEAAGRLVDTLTRLNQEEGLTVIVAEHRFERFLPVCSRLIVLEAGTIAYDGPPAEFAQAKAPLPTPILTLPQGPETPALAFEEIAFTYPGKDHPVLEGASLTVRAGETVVLTGPNGSGKTTLLRHANGLLQPDRGRVIVMGRTIAGRPVTGVAAEVGYLPQHADTHLFAETVEEEIAFAPENLGFSDEKKEDCIAQAIEGLGLAAIGRQARPLALSVGEKQRVAIASIFAMETPVIVLDEPTLGLDPGRKRELAAILREYAHQGRGILVSTHDAGFAALLGGRIVTLRDGRIVSAEEEG
jgi:energy-coupling factor transport system ATP-binding protein